MLECNTAFCHQRFGEIQPKENDGSKVEAVAHTRPQAPAFEIIPERAKRVGRLQEGMQPYKVCLVVGMLPTAADWVEASVKSMLWLGQAQDDAASSIADHTVRKVAKIGHDRVVRHEAPQHWEIRTLVKD
eukprot:2623101-Prymnesium_polylepis.1